MPGMAAISTRRILSGALTVTCLLGAALGLCA
jgi:hypothetical protein